MHIIIFSLQLILLPQFSFFTVLCKWSNIFIFFFSDHYCVKTKIVEKRPIVTKKQWYLIVIDIMEKWWSESVQFEAGYPVGQLGQAQVGRKPALLA